MLSPCLLVLTLLPCARAGWVEISQQHYRKPLRLTDTRTDLKHIFQNPTRITNDENRWENNEQPGNKDTVHHTINKDKTRDTGMDYKEHRWHSQDKDAPNDSKNIDGPRYPTKTVDSDPLQHPAINYIPEHDRPVRLNPFLQDDTANRNGFVTKGDTRNTYIEENLQSERSPMDLNQSLTGHKWGQHAFKPYYERVETKWTDEEFDDWDDDTDYTSNRYDVSRIINKPDVTGIKHKDDRSKYEEKDISETDKSEMVSGKIERIPNIGSVQRVQLANTPVKSPAVKISDVNKKNEANIHRKPNNKFSDELLVTTTIFDSNEDTKISDSKNESSTENSTVYFRKHYFTQAPVFDHVTQMRKGDTTHKETKSPEKTEAGNHVNIAVDVSDFRTSQTDSKPNIDMKRVETSTHKHENNIENDKEKNMHLESVTIEKVTKEHFKSSEKDENPSSGEINVNTMEKILKFMKVVADTISKNTRNGANGKEAYLNELKHALLANIKARIDATWPDDDGASAGRRHSRAASPRGHVEFPSSESALMTISFLTFAVFLIKLVLQVIHTYKHKAMLMAPLMVSTAGRAAAHKLRNSH